LARPEMRNGCLLYRLSQAYCAYWSADWVWITKQFNPHIHTSFIILFLNYPLNYLSTGSSNAAVMHVRSLLGAHH
jgi:hypothetical protein